MLIPIVELLSATAIPLLVIGIPLFAHLRGVKVYESFVEGAQEGFITSIKIIPYLVAMLVAITLLRLSGFFNLVMHIMEPLIALSGIPPEAVPVALIRPLSGSAAFGLVVDILNNYGPDSFVGRLVSTMQGSTDTTFYILTVYFGCVGIRKIRHALIVGLIGDITGFLASYFVCQWVFK
ncbi:MAG: spore maturation protein [bacterium]|jgi:spore maturation protein B